MTRAIKIWGAGTKYNASVEVKVVYYGFVYLYCL